MPDTRLFLLPMPLGNLADLSPRIGDLLRTLPVLFCEDTRTTGKLLMKLQIPSPSLIPLHDHNERRQVGKLLRRLAEGDVGLVSEAGSPVLSDPGFLAVRGAIDAGHTIVSVPGPNAAVSALVASGLPADRFLFAGFPPRGTGRRRAWIQTLATQPASLVFYVSPHRAREVLDDLLHVLGDRPAAIAANLSKQGESIVRGHLSALDIPKGELTLVVGGAEPVSAELSTLDPAIDELLAVDTPVGVIRDVLTGLVDLPRRDVYQRILQRSRT